MKKIATLIILLISFGSYTQEKDLFLEGLGVNDNDRWKLSDSSIVGKLHKAAKDSMYSNTLKGQKYARLSLHISSKIEFFDGVIKSNLILSTAKIYSNEMDSAMLYAEKALILSKKLGRTHFIVKSYEMKGNVRIYSGDFDKAGDEYFNAIKLAEKSNPKDALTSYVNLALVFKNIGNEEKKLEYTKKAYNLASKHKDTTVQITALNLMGIHEKNEGNFELALTQFEEALRLSRIVGQIKRQSEILNNMANVFFKKKEYNKGFELFNQAMEISKTNGTYSSIANGYHTLAMNCFFVERFKEAEKAAEKALEYSFLDENYGLIMESYSALAEIAYANGNNEHAYTFLTYAYMYKDSLGHTETNNAVLSIEDEYKKEKKHLADSLNQIQEEIKTENKKRINEEKVRFRDLLLWSVGFVLLLVLFGVYFLFKNNKLIRAKNELVENQKEEIQIQHNEIKSSIDYAKRIQESIIANDAEWIKVSPIYSVLFKPKDVVSGDFYWAHNNKEKNVSVWAVADCTGHGVPGAFMSMIGIGFLNEIIIENKTYDPGEILTQLRIKIVSALSNDGESQAKDGMDISLCVWDKNTNLLSYAGANNSMWIIRDTDKPLTTVYKDSTQSVDLKANLYEISADKMPIGFQLKSPPPFTTNQINLEKNDTIILFTDGFADQFGGSKNKKYKYKPLKELLLAIRELPAKEQQSQLEDEFESWKGANDQIDDVCIVSVQIEI